MVTIAECFSSYATSVRRADLPSKVVHQAVLTPLGALNILR
jgi:hypothetical protein